MSSSPAPEGEGPESLGSPLLSTSTTSATHLHHGVLHHNRHGHHGNTSTAAQPGVSPNPAGSRGGIRSIPIRLIQSGISILLRIKKRLPEPLQPWFWVGIWLIFVIFGIATFIGLHKWIFQLLENLATFIKGLGSAGPPLIMFGLFLTAFPPVFGYSSLVTISGYVYGFGFGLFIAYTSAFLGSITCFYLCRRWFKSQVRDLMAKKQSMKSIVKAVENRGFKLMLLIRLAPYPFNVMNALLSATHIPLSTFAIATAISLLKLALHVYIGSTLSSLAIVPPTTTPEDGDGNGDTGTPSDTVEGNSHGRTVKIVVMVISMIIGVVVGAYVWIVAKREIEASEGNRVERRRRKRESLRQGLTRSSTGKSRSHGRTSSATASSFSQLLRTAPSLMGGFDLSNQDRIQSIDPVGNGESSDFVGGSSMNVYLDDDEGKESQALVSSDGFHGGRRRSGSSSHAGYDTESEESDFVDDDDDDISDMERGVEDEDQFMRNSTEMSMRDLSHSLSSPRRTEPVNWFAENGVDVGERW